MNGFVIMLITFTIVVVVVVSVVPCSHDLDVDAGT